MIALPAKAMEPAAASSRPDQDRARGAEVRASSTATPWWVLFMIGRARDGFPSRALRGALRLRRIEQLQRVLAQHEVLRRRIRTEDFEQDLRRARRVAALLAARFLPTLAHRVEAGVVVGDRSRRAHHRASGPVRAERAGSHRGDADAQAAQLLVHRLRDALERELAAAVV